MKRASGGRPQAGLSLVELMLASSIGLIVVAAVGGLFLSSSQNYRQDERMTFMQQELAYAMAQLVQDIEMAGYWARIHDPALVETHSSLAVSADCGKSGANWAFDDRTALTVTDNAIAADVHKNHQCIDEADVRPGADVIAIKRVQGRVSGTEVEVDAGTLPKGVVYLRTGNLSGLLYLHTGAAIGKVPPPFENWEYRAVVYYIQPYVDTVTEPALCRQILRATGETTKPEFEKECLAQGVENLQIEVGIDTDQDGAANYFLSAPKPADLARAVAVRLYLLARSAKPDFLYANEKTYGGKTDGGKTYMAGNAKPFKPTGAEVNYYRKTLTTEIVLRNPRSLQGLAFQ